MKSLIIMWAVAFVLLLIVEGATAQLVTIWFAAGALVALIAAALKAPLWLQIALFVVVSAITLVATRPIVRKITNRKAENLHKALEETNAKKKLTRVVPPLKSVEKMIAEAKALEPKMTY